MADTGLPLPPSARLLLAVRAEPPPHGSDDHLALELYLAWRANGLAIETPAIRR